MGAGCDLAITLDLNRGCFVTIDTTMAYESDELGHFNWDAKTCSGACDAGCDDPALGVTATGELDFSGTNLELGFIVSNDAYDAGMSFCNPGELLEESFDAYFFADCLPVSGLYEVTDISCSASGSVTLPTDAAVLLTPACEYFESWRENDCVTLSTGSATLDDDTLAIHLTDRECHDDAGQCASICTEQAHIGVSLVTDHSLAGDVWTTTRTVDATTASMSSCHVGEVETVTMTAF